MGLFFSPGSKRIRIKAKRQRHVFLSFFFPQSTRLNVYPLPIDVLWNSEDVATKIEVRLKAIQELVQRIKGRIDEDKQSQTKHSMTSYLDS